MPERQVHLGGKHTRAVMPRRVNPGQRASKGGAGATATTPAGVSAVAKRTRRQQQQQQWSGCRRQQVNDVRQGAAADVRQKHTRDGNLGKQRMSQWLRKHLDTGEVTGLEWEDRDSGVFSICWVHKSNHNFDQNRHSDIFSRYAEYRDQSSTSFSSNKANFRCALNSLKDVQQLTKEGAKKGAKAKRTFRFLSPSDPQYGKNRMKNKVAGGVSKGKKRKAGSPKESDRSSRSSSCSSALESPPPSPRNSEASSFCDVDRVTMPQPGNVVMDSSSSDPIMEVEASAPTQPVSPYPLVGAWTANILEPVEDRKIEVATVLPSQDEDGQRSNLTYLTDPNGITHVNTVYCSPKLSGVVSPPIDIEIPLPRDDETASTRVEVEPNIQSGGTVTGLPDFSMLGVSDTYAPEKTYTSKQLACGGEVRIREGKNFALPIPIDINKYIEQIPARDATDVAQKVKTSPTSSTPPCSTESRTSLLLYTQPQIVDQQMVSLPYSTQAFRNEQVTFLSHCTQPYVVSQTIPLPPSTRHMTLMPNFSQQIEDQQATTLPLYTHPSANQHSSQSCLIQQTASLPTQFRGIVQTDLNLGQTLDISDTDSQVQCPDLLSEAYSDAATTILSHSDAGEQSAQAHPTPQSATGNNDMMNVPNICSAIGSDLTNEPTSEENSTLLPAVEVQHIQQADSLPLIDFPPDEFQDLFSLGSI